MCNDKKGNSLIELLKNNGLKVTPQRIAILKEIAKAGHISVEDIYSNIKYVFPSVSLATVYKNINSMKTAGIIYEIHTQGAKSKFEIRKKAHAHFICQYCNSVRDILIDEEDFKIYGDFNQIDLYLYGICEKCKKSKSDS